MLITYLLFVARGFKTAMLARDSFSTLLAVGLSAMFALQVFVIVGGVTRVIPLTGVTLPFISYGGSSIVANLVLVALLLLISDRARRPAVSAPIVRLFGVVVVLFALLVSFTSRWTVFEASSLNNNPLNVRTLLDELQIKRGRILADDGTVLAKSVPAPGGTWSRTYPTAALFAQPVGYSIAAQGGRPGSSSPPGRICAACRPGSSSIFGQLSPRPVGDDVYTTLDPKAQRVARAAAGRAGRSVVALDPQDGRGAWPCTPTRPTTTTTQTRRQARRRQLPVNSVDPGRVAAGLDVQGGHRDGGDRQRQVHPELGDQRRLAEDDLRAFRSRTTATRASATSTSRPR